MMRKTKIIQPSNRLKWDDYAETCGKASFHTAAYEGYVV
jgi:hypothetical protein